MIYLLKHSNNFSSFSYYIDLPKKLNLIKKIHFQFFKISIVSN